VSLGLCFGNNPVNLLSVLLGAGIAAFLIVLAACRLNFAHLKTRGAVTLPNPSLEPVVSSP